MVTDEKYMRRALALARKGEPYASPNPMVGCVIAGPGGSIIGEGYHRRCGQAHAEVNAVASVADPAMLTDCTMYVTLEPCAHYGRTPPCAEMIVRKGIPRVVVGTRDPFGKVDGRGIDIMRRAGIEVEVGMLEQECQRLNAIFFTAHTLKRPFVMLKWAQSADGYLDCKRSPGERQAVISTPLTMALMHRLRTRFGAIMAGSGTVLADDPSLTARLWPGPQPLRVVMDRRGRVPAGSKVLAGAGSSLRVGTDQSLEQTLAMLYADHGITSVLVEGGATLLASFIEQGLWDAVRIETGAVSFGANGTVCAPAFDLSLPPAAISRIDGNTIAYYGTLI